ncbi:MAG TPA: hypothetical protein VMA73_16650 [Streptosporangiaceae bacterium]|nr:hypothetical protein [Streptosporangiaceae bacterium]
MPATVCECDHQQLHDKQELAERLALYSLRTSSGVAGEKQDVCWVQVLSTDGFQIRRDVWRRHQPWQADSEGWEPEGVIWPTWPVRPADEPETSESALTGVQKYWNKTGNRLRDSAKWMATVLGAALATLIGTSPLSSIRNHHSTGSIACFLIGLLLLGITLLLVVQVMQPQAVSFSDVQSAPAEDRWSALGNWKKTVESHQDLYLPCGVKCLTSLRQSMIIEKMTLMALAQAKEHDPGREMRKQLEEAQEARVLRLNELRRAAASVAMIGEYYKLRGRSTRATYGGIVLTLLASAAIVAAVAWP